MSVAHIIDLVPAADNDLNSFSQQQLIQIYKEIENLQDDHKDHSVCLCPDIFKELDLYCVYLSFCTITYQINNNKIEILEIINNDLYMAKTSMDPAQRIKYYREVINNEVQAVRAIIDQ